MSGDEATVPAGGLTARKLRGVRFDAVRETVREALTRLRLDEGQEEELFGPGGLLAERRIEPEAYRQDLRRRGQHDDDSLAAVASVYAAEVQAGTRSPLAVAARQLGYSTAHTKRLVKKARDRGLLTDTERRRAGGVLTEKARALLASSESPRLLQEER